MQLHIIIAMDHNITKIMEMSAAMVATAVFTKAVIKRIIRQTIAMPT